MHLFAQVIALLQHEQRISYRVLKRRFALSDDDLADLKDELIYAKKLAETKRIASLCDWGHSANGTADFHTFTPTTSPVAHHRPRTRTPILHSKTPRRKDALTSRSALEG